jgi:multidrug efflux pump subunit AcrA (membrane-fusion protein)
MRQLLNSIRKDAGYDLQSPQKIYRADKESNIKRWFWMICLFLVVLMWMPWTQNIQATGTITTLYQDQRPQQLNSIIPGRILKWWVKEGDFVKKGDTIVQLADVKDDYLDPQLMQRTNEQVDAKQQKMVFYQQKISATESQIIAMENARELKLNSLDNKMEQIRRKMLSDSAEIISAEVDYQVAVQQLSRAKEMYARGIITLVEFEKRSQQFNKALAVLTEKQQKFQNSKQDVIICSIEMNSTRQDAADKIFKARGEIASAQSEIASTSGDLSKNRNQLSNYEIRGSQRWLIAPQNGQLVKAKKSGINEMVKEGDMIAEIVPTTFNYAAELFISPMDLVLLNKGQRVTLIFDGFPAMVFSGWPAASYGIFVGEVTAVETNLSENGKFRVLVTQNSTERQWPSELKIGTGVQGFALLKNVSIWYELWRQINGFPPEYYKKASSSKPEIKKK